MRISVNKTVGSSSIHITLKDSDDETIEKIQKVAQELFDRLPEPSFTSNDSGMTILGGMPMPMFDKPEEQA